MRDVEWDRISSGFTNVCTAKSLHPVQCVEQAGVYSPGIAKGSQLEKSLLFNPASMKASQK